MSEGRPGHGRRPLPAREAGGSRMEPNVSKPAFLWTFIATSALLLPIAAGLRDNTIRLGDKKHNGTYLPRPAPGRPYSASAHIETRFKTGQTPVFHRDRFVPGSADISWHFAPTRSSIVRKEAVTEAGSWRKP